MRIVILWYDWLVTTTKFKFSKFIFDYIVLSFVALNGACNVPPITSKDMPNIVV